MVEDGSYGCGWQKIVGSNEKQGDGVVFLPWAWWRGRGGVVALVRSFVGCVVEYSIMPNKTASALLCLALLGSALLGVAWRGSACLLCCDLLPWRFGVLCM